MAKKLLRDIVSARVVSVEPATVMSRAVSLMAEKRISCLVVLDGRRPVGIFTERDLIKAVERKKDLSGCVIEEFMSAPVLTASSSVDIYEAYNLLAQSKIRHVVVADKGAVTGVVTQSDILKNLGFEFFVDFKNIASIMTKNVVMLGREEPVSHAVSKMAKHSISCIVVEDESRPVGIVTERDVTRLFHEGVDMERTLVERVMSSPVKSIRVGASIYEVAGVMEENNIRRLVVVDSEGQISGLITQFDIIKGMQGGYIESLKEAIKKKDRKLKRTEKNLTALKDIDQMKTNIISNVSHELRTPITIIKSATDLLDDTPSGVDREKILSTISNALIRLDDIVGDLINAAYINAGKHRLFITDVNIARLAEDALEDIESRAEKKQVALKNEVSSNLPLVRGDPTALKKIIRNLLGNAVKFNFKGGVVTIDAHVQDGEILVSVSDTGSGISEEEFDSIFLPLYQIDATTTRAYGGTGMGLAVTKSLVEAHGGKIEMRSAVGQGSVFSFTVPIYSKSEEEK